LIAFPLSIGGLVLAQPILLFLYKREIYLEATASFQLLLFLPLVIFISMIIGHALIAAGLQKQSMVGIVIGAVVNVILNLLLIPRFGIDGAAVATIAAELAVLLYIYPIYRKKIGHPIWTAYIFKPLLAAILMGGAIYLLPDSFPVILQVILGGIIYGVTIIMLRGI